MSDLLLVALITAIPPTLAVVIAALNTGKKLNHITILTNSTHKAAVERITELEKQVITLKSENFELGSNDR